MDYRVYHLTRREGLLLIPLSAGASLMLSWLFYDSFYGVIITPLVALLLAVLLKQERCQKRSRLLAEEFLDAMRSVSTALLAGYSMENAWLEAEKEMKMLRGKESILLPELSSMNRRLAMNVPLEEVLEDFAGRSGNEDIAEFAEIFRFAKRGGGSLTGIIEGTTSRMTGRFDTEKEISVAVASRRMEQRVMNLIPLGMIAYLKLGSGDYMEPLYGNLFGVLFMTLCLLAYGLAFFLSGKVMDIHV